MNLSGINVEDARVVADGIRIADWIEIEASELTNMMVERGEYAPKQTVANSAKCTLGVPNPFKPVPKPILAEEQARALTRIFRRFGLDDEVGKFSDAYNQIRAYAELPPIDF